MKVFREGMAGSNWSRRKAVSACKTGRGLGEPAVAGARQLAGQKKPFWMSFQGPKCTLSRVSYCNALTNIKCCTNTKSRMANNFVMLKHSCQVINVLIVII